MMRVLVLRVQLWQAPPAGVDVQNEGGHALLLLGMAREEVACANEEFVRRN